MDLTDPVLPPEAVMARGDALILLDTRPEAAFLAGRADGARHLPIEAWDRAIKSGQAPLDDAAHWGGVLGGLGLDGGKPVVVLDDGRMTEAARAWFLLQHFGLAAAVLDGGWPALEPLLEAPVSGPAAAPAAVACVARPGTGRVALMERAPLRDALASQARPQVFDTRSPAEHRGEDLKNNRRGGRLPGAANLPHTALLAQGNRLMPAEALRARMEEVGLSLSRTVVTHCDGGGRAALAALAAVRAGHPDVAAYYMSFADWAADEACPIER
ncbi:sulfurtransferase [Roseococcus suduntuyensis]|uniref:Thiosulfate/3-mercaptopyruvate sulfurtransferase n=1 Tax=Roseococcus suduntuyensis TaxID=455361 RepID=A0A840AGR2_9PROT|nr:rhodanese-like domain-containing protein [Roseococcus suduntuyensis]MBB3900207.1 thiosulfate/3-mercaptopyruvate sulfurtransferase [Roseococcus suduntuyensis]